MLNEIVNSVKHVVAAVEQDTAECGMSLYMVFVCIHLFDMYFVEELFLTKSHR